MICNTAGEVVKSTSPRRTMLTAPLRSALMDAGCM
jgi:hypothetical protein